MGTVTITRGSYFILQFALHLLYLFIFLKLAYLLFIINFGILCAQRGHPFVASFIVL